MKKTTASTVRQLLLPLILGVLLACGKGEDEHAGAVADHPLARALVGVRPAMTGLDETETAAIDTFIHRAGSRTSVFEVRRICGLAGKGLNGADPKTVAGFVVRARPALYDDFFRNLDEVALVRVADVLRELPEASDVERLRYGTIIGTGRGIYKGTLARALTVVGFSDLVKPIALAQKTVLPAADAPVEAWQGAAEMLRMKGFVLPNPRVDLAVDTYLRALEKWPDDPALLCGLAALYIEYGDRYSGDLLPFLRRAHYKDRENAVYAYLLAAQHFRYGKDDQALAALQSARDRPTCTFHSLERARRTAKFLESRGYEELRARIAAYQTTSMAALFELKDLANRALMRSREYQVEKRVDALETVLAFPEVLSRQILTSPRTRHTELLRARILATGLSRRASWVARKDPKDAERLRAIAVDAERRVMRIEKGEDLCGQQKTWGKLYDLLGKEKFLTYVDHVLFGNEADFLAKCADLESVDQAVELAVADYPF